MEIFRFEVNHEYIIEYVEAVEHNSWTVEVHFYTFSVFQTVWGILYYIRGQSRQRQGFIYGSTLLLLMSKRCIAEKA